MHLILDHISKEIGKRKILDDISFSVEPGEVFGILGPDGAGKSSLLKVIAGIWGATGGTVSADGRTFRKTPEEVRGLIGYMTFSEGLREELTAVENLEYAAGLYNLPPSEAPHRIATLLERTGLFPFKDLPVRNFSGGMKQKVALCSALIHKPRLLLLDEPSTGIDPLSRRRFWELLFDLPEKGVTILVTTPYFDEIRRCGRAALLSDGRILWTGSPAREDIEDLFYRRLKETTDRRGETAELDLEWVRSREEGVNSLMQADGIRKSFGKVEALKETSFAIRPGEIFGLIGSNGAGKTTLIRMLCGLLAPDTGRIAVFGKNPFDRKDLLQERIGYMSQLFSLYQDLTVRENLRFYGGLYSLPSDLLKERIEWLCRITGMEGQKDRLVGELPTGWRQRLALGCVLLHDPSIIFLDEPTSGVDPVTRRYFWRWIRFLAGRGRTVIVSTHYMTEAEQCHRLMLMHQGEVLALGAPGELCPPGRSLEDVFVEKIRRQEA